VVRLSKFITHFRTQRTPTRETLACECDSSNCMRRTVLEANRCVWACECDASNCTNHTRSESVRLAIRILEKHRLLSSDGSCCSAKLV
jgi:hypothetical protein